LNYSRPEVHCIVLAFICSYCGLGLCLIIALFVKYYLFIFTVDRKVRYRRAFHAEKYFIVDINRFETEKYFAKTAISALFDSFFSAFPFLAHRREGAGGVYEEVLSFF